MNYEKFKEEFAQRFRDYLPKPYNTWTLKLCTVPKVNGFVEAINLLPENEAAAVPNLYVSDLYEAYQFYGGMDEMLKRAAEAFVIGMKYTRQAAQQLDLEDPRGHIVYMLINTEMNGELLKDVPHRSFLDLTIIYRLIVDCPGEGFNSAIIDHRMAEQYQLDEEELFRIAAENTPRLMPPIVESISESFYLLTNRQRTLGASALLYQDILECAAEKMGADLFLLPSSIHEVFLIPDAGQNRAMMRRTVVEANQSVVKKSEVLSDNVYHYCRATGALTVASDSENRIS